ncbi:SDR family oxidoreductase [Anaerolentibacter hominis]|uniref:SDR family NAD(P)-dependent oxidoreductase n=1 Tax=Anaerolentibacter hominis TaxID=3079009 RepID=UPI0031B87B1A
MELGLKGKVAVITGGSKGIGLAAAKEFLLEGAKVAICARREAELNEAAVQLSAYGEVYKEVVDASSEEQVYAFAAHVAERFGTIDCWVNNVGASFPRDGEEYTGADIDRITGVTFKSAVFGCQAAFRYMKKHGGAIVNISSLAARCPTAGRSTLYGPLKAAIVNLTITFAGEYAAYGVRVNCVMPGFTMTEAVARNIPPAELSRNASGTLLNRVARPEEIARPVVFLASEAASYMTAETIEVSGGRSVTLNPGFSFEERARKQD